MPHQRFNPRCRYAVMTFEEIADALGISQSMVQQLYLDGMKKLAENRDALRDALELAAELDRIRSHSRMRPGLVVLPSEAQEAE